VSAVAQRPEDTLMTIQPATLLKSTPTVKLLLDGKFVESQTSEWQDVVNPATQEVLAQVPHCHRCGN
jgi:malonate-semialdehyde dehydrogenase (acetylating)/methylmalonate-semialdehyde dehydrogenase